MKNKECVLLIHDIRSVYNVGAIFRTADAVGVTKIILSGYSPTPLDRFGRERTDFAKCALGAEKNIPWEYLEAPYENIQTLKQEGFHVVGLEQDERSVDYKKNIEAEKLVIILGTETTGMTQELLSLCDTIMEIPMRGIKESLNVSVAAGILLYRVLDN